MISDAKPFEGGLIHQVFFWLKTPGSEADRAKLVAGLESLRAIPQIRQLFVGTPARTERREVVDASWDVSELMVFDSLADQAAYQEHPIHQAFVEQCGGLIGRLVVYDAAPASPRPPG